MAAVFFRHKRHRQHGEEACGLPVGDRHSHLQDAAEPLVASEARREVVPGAGGRGDETFQASTVTDCGGFKFHSRTRRPRESVGVRSLAEFCNFRDTLEVMLLDRIVCGINDDAIQKRPLAEPALNYEKAVETVMNMETVAQSMKELKSRSDSHPTHTPLHHQVHRTSATPISSTSLQVKSGPSTCYRCGFRGHTVSKCWADKNVVCGKKCHIRCVCRSKQKTQQSSQQSAGKGNFQTVCQLEDEEESDSQSLSGSPLCHVKSSAVHHSPPIRVKVKLDECLVGMEVDIGAAVSMSEATFRELWPTRELLCLQAYSNPCSGILQRQRQYDGQTAADSGWYGTGWV